LRGKRNVPNALHAIRRRRGEESRGRGLLRRGLCRKVKFYCPLPESPSGRLLIRDPNPDPNLDLMVAHMPLQVIYLVVTMTVILVRVFSTWGILSHRAI
jgi:hypothetical protein